MYLSVVIPCYREADALRNTVEALMNLLQVQGLTEERFEIVIVVEYSNSGTLEVAKRLAEQRTEVRVLANDKKYGKGYSVRRGVMESLGAFILVVDADLPVNLMKYFPIMRSLIEQENVASVYAVALGDKTSIRKRGFLRANVSFALFNFRRWLLDQYITDTQLGCKLYVGEVIRRCIQQVDEVGFLYEIQLTDLLLREGALIEECSVRIDSFSEKSSVNLWEVFRNAIRFFSYILFERRRLMKP